MRRRNILREVALNELYSMQNTSDTLLKKSLDFAKASAVKRYGFTFEINDRIKVQKVNEWIKKNDPKFDSRQISDNGLLSNTSVFIPIDVNTFVYVIAGKLFGEQSAVATLLRTNGRNDDDGMHLSNTLKVFIYGKYARKYIKQITDLIIYKPSDQLKLFTISAKDRDGDSFNSVVQDLNARKISSLFYEDGVLDQVTKHFDGFFENKQLYESKQLNFKTSILLYGPPGTGKSSLANALCERYGIDMVLVDMNTFNNLDVGLLTNCINGDDKTYMIVLEDIDTVFNVNREDEGLDKDDKKVINKLLQFMDSNSSPNNVIFVCTTNHIEKLDEAIKRKGRIDKNVYIGPINKHVARTMCKSFDISDDNIDKILSKYSDNDLINQSSLQADILDVIKEETVAAAGDIEEAPVTVEEPANETVKVFDAVNVAMIEIPKEEVKIDG